MDILTAYDLEPAPDGIVAAARRRLACGSNANSEKETEASMRLGTKLAAFAIILLLPKTSLYFSNPGVAEAQIAPERPMSAPTVGLKDAPTGYARVSAERERAQSATCAAAGADRSAVLVHVADTGEDDGPSGRRSR